MHAQKLPYKLKLFQDLPENSHIWKDFWPPYSTIRPDDYSRFLALSRKGKKLEPFSAPVGVDKKKAQQDYQLAELEKEHSIL